jgi:integrative and conjugative element protein (TIGR02256 family)
MEKDKLTIWLKNEALREIEKQGVAWGDLETGGILIGYWANESVVVITSVIGPGPKALHTPTSFVPDQAYHERELERIYKQSNRTETYLGDWHTHPNESAYLSGLDKHTLKKIAGFKPARLRKPLMLILGTKEMITKIWYFQKGYLLTSKYIECPFFSFD